MDQKIVQAISTYYEDNAKKLHFTVNQIFHRHYGGINGKDIEEFYGIGTDVLAEIWEKNKNGNETFDFSKGDFDGYVYNAIRMAIIDEFKRQNRDKRKTKVFLLDENGDKVLDEKTGKPIKVPVPDIRLDAPLKEGEYATLKDMIPSDFEMNKEIQGICKNEKIEKFLQNLPMIQRQISEMIMEGFSVSEIKERMNLSSKEYADNFQQLRSFKNISILCNDVNSKYVEDEKMSEITQTTQTMENCKTDKISIASIVKKIDRHTIRFDHPLQRESDQWSPSMKGNLVSDILQGNKLHPLIFAEQIINGVPIIWDLDGKQRCTNAYSYSKNGYKVSKNIRRWMIKYQTIEKDENGNEVLDERGFPIPVNAEFDIRGKRFSELPEELQDRFLDYTFNYDQYLNCSEEDIGYHIERYNDGKSMTSPQKGIMKLGTEYAEIVKSISNMSFFKDMGGYKVSEFKNGTINRVVVESIMTTNYFDNWGKLDNMCKHIKENSDTTVFDNFEDMVERLEKVITDDVSDMFDSKDSFLWFGLFAKFIKTETDDRKFIEFMTEFGKSLHKKTLHGTSFDNILEESNSTKDKGIVTKKMNHLELLMNNYFNINENEGENSEIETDEAFIARNVNVDINELHNDMEFYGESLDDLTNNTIRDGSKLLDKQNRLSLLAMVVYSYKHDVDLEDWLTEFAQQYNTYLVDQGRNFLYMKDDFEKFIKNKEREERKTA